jgi:hypothetical protein
MQYCFLTPKKPTPLGIAALTRDAEDICKKDL